MKNVFLSSLLLAGIIAFYGLFNPKTVSAHCDTMDGPVVTAGQKSLSTGNPNHSLIWVKPSAEEDIKKALEKARNKRKSGDKSGDIEFFETLVRIHRQGEGAGFTGLKPAGQVEAEIAMADQSLASKDVSAILAKLDLDNKEIIEKLFNETVDKSNFPIDDLEKGREYVESYVKYVHSVEAALQGRSLSDNHHTGAEEHVSVESELQSVLGLSSLAVGVAAILGLGTILYFILR